MKKIIYLIQNTEGKKKYALSFFFGMLVTLAFSPVYIIPAAVLGFSAHLLQLETCKNKKQAFWLGWWFGWGHFTSGLYWISFALLTDVQQFGWMIPFAVFGIPAILAFYIATVSCLTFAIPQKGYRRVMLFAVFWTIIEIARSYLFTGFPWLLTGYIWTVSDSMLQLASITGIYGLSFFTVLAFAMPVTIINRGFAPAIIAFVGLSIIWTGGYYRLADTESNASDIMVRVVQANISQRHKWDSEKRRDIVQKYISMTYSKGFNKVSHVIWPESALPYFIDEDSELLSIIKNVTPKNGTIITGSMHAKQNSYGFVEDMWNSVHIINANGKIMDIYNKHHLVPFGEYVPFRSILPIEKITPGTRDFSSGTGPRTLSIPDFPQFSPLICYEAIFPEEAIDKNNPPALMINFTNDAWYGNTSGPYQHFNMVRVRAVEYGIPLIRAANTGISGIIDSYGRVVSKTNLGETVILDEYIPSPLQTATIYTKFGNYIVLLIISIFCIIATLPPKNL